MSRKNVLRLILLAEAIFAVWWYRPYTQIDPELNKYFAPVNNVAKRYCRDGEFRDAHQQVIKFSTDMNSDDLGVCISGLVNTTILINKDTWTYLSEAEKFQLMLHEITHCYLSYNEHSDWPKHYMYPVLIELKPWTVLAQYSNQMMKRCTKWNRN